MEMVIEMNERDSRKKSTDSDLFDLMQHVRRCQLRTTIDGDQFVSGQLGDYIIH